ncbi:GNAT family N-acetyltransferase [Hymenobacter jeollabukensis]|uniref:GNAT family N-acetyltransferase n=1 Tax=Hymenobacter jeollabukensis TaxID=2025313 RepID=A0A5R8WJP7_9BACT|nr:GNAT family N-acetyltransferase [Hymenobacter jeollabukensis]TLM88910.1 GNAT family N-acetyltransferase [Hymenobacter jeollabukensis]
MTIPQLETERLRLRGHRPDDFAALLAMWQQPAFYQYLNGAALPAEDVWKRLLQNTGLWHLLGFGYWAVEEKATGQCIGAAGFAEWQRAIRPTLQGYPEAGWVLAPSHHGRGYATEAVRAILAWADTYLPPRSVCLVHAAHAASLRVAAKCGYAEFARTDYHQQPVVLLERPASTLPRP